MRVRSIIATALLAGALTSCSHERQDSADSPTPAATAIETARPLMIGRKRINQAVDGVRLPGRLEVTERCVTERHPNCTLRMYGALRSSAIAAEGPVIPTANGSSEVLSFGVVTWPSARSARQDIRSSKHHYRPYDGKVRIRLVKGSTSYNPGESGHGSIQDITVGGWTGFRMVATIRNRFLDAPISNPQLSEFVTLRRGVYTLNLVSARAMGASDPWPVVRRQLLPALELR